MENPSIVDTSNAHKQYVFLAGHTSQHSLQASLNFWITPIVRVNETPRSTNKATRLLVNVQCGLYYIVLIKRNVSGIQVHFSHQPFFPVSFTYGYEWKKKQKENK